MPIPAPVLGFAQAPGESFNDAIERIIATPFDLLAEEIARSSAVLGNGVWDVAARDPDRCLRRYVAMLLRAWKGFGSICSKHARPLIAKSSESAPQRHSTRSWSSSMTCFPLLSSSATAGTSMTTCYDGPMRFPDSGVILTPLVASEVSKGLLSSRRHPRIRVLSRAFCACTRTATTPSRAGRTTRHPTHPNPASTHTSDQHRHTRRHPARRTQRRHPPRQRATSSWPRTAPPPRTQRTRRPHCTRRSPPRTLRRRRHQPVAPTLRRDLRRRMS